MIARGRDRGDKCLVAAGIAVHFSCKKNLSKPATACMASSGNSCGAMGGGVRLICVELNFPPSQPRAARQRIANASCRSCCVEPSRKQPKISFMNVGIYPLLSRDVSHDNPHSMRTREECSLVGANHKSLWQSLTLRSGVCLITPDSDSYLLGMQKQRLLPSGSVTANSRSPHV